MGRTLDRTKDYGIICGGTGEARFYQFGVYFDVAGNEVGADEEEVQEQPKNKGGRPRKVEQAPLTDIDPELEAQINANLEG